MGATCFGLKLFAQFVILTGISAPLFWPLLFPASLQTALPLTQEASKREKEFDHGYVASGFPKTGVLPVVSGKARTKV